MTQVNVPASVDVSAVPDAAYAQLADAVVKDPRFAQLGFVDAGSGVSAAVLSGGSLPRRLVRVRDSLLSNTSGVRAFNAAAPVVGAPEFPVDRFEQLAEEFLTRARLDAANEVLPDAVGSGLVIARMNVPVTHEGIISLAIHATNKARGNPRRIDQNIDYLRLWDAYELSGYDPDYEGEFPLAVISTKYDRAREGDHHRQLAGLKEVCADFPDVTIGAATLGDGIILGHRDKIIINRRAGSNINETSVRMIESEPHSFNGLVSVPFGEVVADGRAHLYESHLDDRDAARLLIR